jgi:hypothetical protein
MPRKLNVVNSSDKSWSSHSFILTFGAYGSTHLLVYADNLDDAVEISAQWLAKNAPGHIMLHDDPTLTDLRREACEEAGLVWPPPADANMDAYYAAFETAEADLTYTESGYLTSHEWMISAENPTPSQIREFVRRPW